MLVFELVLLQHLIAWPGATESEDPKKLVEKAIRAHGGRENLKQCQRIVLTTQGTYRFGMDTCKLEAQFWLIAPNYFRADVNVSLGPLKSRGSLVLANNEGWRKDQTGVRALASEEVKEVKDDAYCIAVARLLPIVDDPSITSAMLREVYETLDKKRVTLAGIRVKKKDHVDVYLYFDKDTHLLTKVKTESKQSNGKTQIDEILHLEYAKSGKLFFPKRFVKLLDGEQQSEERLLEVRPLLESDENAFSMPK